MRADLIGTKVEISETLCLQIICSIGMTITSVVVAILGTTKIQPNIIRKITLSTSLPMLAVNSYAAYKGEYIKISEKSLELRQETEEVLRKFFKVSVDIYTIISLVTAITMISLSFFSIQQLFFKPLTSFQLGYGVFGTCFSGHVISMIAFSVSGQLIPKLNKKNIT